MTGREFYERFEAEMKPHYDKGGAITVNGKRMPIDVSKLITLISEAAKKAAGIK